MKYFYNFGIYCYYFVLSFAAFLGHQKARKWLNGRVELLEALAQKRSAIGNEKLIWVHAASLGEFEQGRPIIEYIKKNSNAKVLLTFFSPSGYDIRKNYPLADIVSYLPLDTPDNAKKFVEIAKPAALVLIKNEFWFNHLEAIQKQQIPCVLISALFTESDIFFKPYGDFFLKKLKNFKHIFVQNEKSLEYLKKYQIFNVTKSGDTRIDSVLNIASKHIDFPAIQAFKENKLLLIAGSTWQKDEAILATFINNPSNFNYKLLIAPHDISQKRINEVCEQFTQRYAKYSNLENTELSSCRILIIDNIGILSQIYKYGDVAYIGGGFGAGIHNTLEPAAFSLPIIFGTRFQKFEEAVQLCANGGAFSIKNDSEFQIIMDKLNSEENRQKSSKQVAKYIQSNKGASEQVCKYLHENIL